MKGERKVVKLKKPCSFCDKKFQPLGTREKLCPKCYKLKRSFTYIQHCKTLRELHNKMEKVL
jgi:hypothetical protein